MNIQSKLWMQLSTIFLVFWFHCWFNSGATNFVQNFANTECVYEIQLLSLLEKNTQTHTHTQAARFCRSNYESIATRHLCRNNNRNYFPWHEYRFISIAINQHTLLARVSKVHALKLNVCATDFNSDLQFSLPAKTNKFQSIGEKCEISSKI